LPAKQF